MNMAETAKNTTRKRRRRIAILLCIVLGAGGMGAGVFKYRRHRLHLQCVAWRTNGMSAFAAGDYRMALENLGNYLGHYPDDRGPLYQYAVSRLRVPSPHGQNVADAVFVLRNFVRLEPNDAAARRLLLELFVQVGFDAEALEQASYLRTHGYDADAEILKLHTTSLMRLR